MKATLPAGKPTLLLALTSLLLLSPDVSAQRRGGFGIGGQLGEPTGVTLKFATGSRAIDAAAEYDNDVLFIQSHLILSERPISGTGGDVNFFYGPGVFFATGNDVSAFGLSFNAGVSFYTGPLEIFGQATPQLLLTPDTDFDLGAAVGLRFYP